MIYNLFLIFAILLLISCHIYYNFGYYFLNLFFKKELIMKYYYKYYNKYLTFILRLLMIKPRIINSIPIQSDKRNILIYNHSSILDSLFVGYICNENRITYDNLKTVSRYSRKNFQNKTMKFLDNLIVKNNLKDDIKNLNLIIKKWKSNTKLNVVIFPEGTITTNENLEKSKYKFLLEPKIGIINSLLEKMDYDNIYDITICYHIKNKKLIGEKNIILNMLNPKLSVTIMIKKINNDFDINELWDSKDKLIYDILNKYD